MKNIISFLFFVLGSISSYTQPTSPIQKLESAIEELYKTNRFNGTVLYGENGKISYCKAFGVADFRTSEPLNTNSSFNLASITKQFVAMGIMILSDKGKLSFDEDMRQYIPEMPYKNITIRNLLTHTSGIPEYFDLYTKYRETLDTLTNSKMINLFANYQPPLDFETGTKWSYCNTNYVLLASIIEKITKQSLAEFINDQISKPLGLKETYVYHLLMSSVPKNHVYGFSEINGTKKLNDLIHVDGVTGDGNLYSSVEDLLKWDQSLYTEKLVKKTTLLEAFTPVKLKDGSSYPYGFGWFIDSKNDLYSHTGSWGGFRNIICRDVKNKSTLIVLSSGDNDLARTIAKSIFTNTPYELPKTALITNINVVDGTGSPSLGASVRIQNNKIIAVGNLKAFANEKVIDGEVKFLVPGFIDSHSHVDRSISQFPDALAAVSQGITTIVVGQDGESDPMDSLKAGYLQIPKAINMANYTGHTSIREKVMGINQLNRPATREELEKIKVLLEEDLKKGSLGLSTGLEYEGAFYSNRDEVIELAKVAAAANGKYISHLRSEDINMADALDEIIEIGRQAKLPVQISHIKIALRDDWGTAPSLIAKLQNAREEGIDITADCYPYEYWNSTIRVLFPKKDFTSIVGANYAVDHLFDPDGSVMVRFKPDTAYKGKTVGAIAKMRNEKPAETLLYLVAAAEAYEKLHPQEDGVETIMGKSMSNDDIVPFLSWEHTNICSDGANGGHPRGYGAFTRLLSLYVKDKKIMSFENAINKMTALSAENVGIKNRGVIASGNYADMVLLDFEKVKDNANIQNPKALSDGILIVWVNGEIVYKNKESTMKFPGVLITR